MSTVIFSHEFHQAARIAQARAVGAALGTTLQGLARTLRRLRQRVVLTGSDLNRNVA